MFRGLRLGVVHTSSAQAKLLAKKVAGHKGTLCVVSPGSQDDGALLHEIRGFTHVLVGSRAGCARAGDIAARIHALGESRRVPVVRIGWVTESLRVGKALPHQAFAVPIAASHGTYRSRKRPRETETPSSSSAKSLVSPPCARARIVSPEPAGVCPRQARDIPPSRSSETPSSPASIQAHLPNILTWNANNMGTRMRAGTLSSLGSVAELNDCDVICVQEVCLDEGDIRSCLEESLDGSPGSRVDTPPRPRRGRSDGRPVVESFTRLAGQLPTKNYMVRTRCPPTWLPDGFNTSYWSVYAESKGSAKGKGVAVFCRDGWAVPSNRVSFSLSDHMPAHKRWNEGRCIVLEYDRFTLLTVYCPQDALDQCVPCNSFDLLRWAGDSRFRAVDLARVQARARRDTCFRTQFWDPALRAFAAAHARQGRALVCCGDMNASHDPEFDRMYMCDGSGPSRGAPVYLTVPPIKEHRTKVHRLGGRWAPSVLHSRLGFNAIRIEPKFRYCVPPGVDPEALRDYWPQQQRVVDNFNSLFQPPVGLVDAWRHTHPGVVGGFTNLPCRRVRLRLDYVLVSASLSRRIASCEVDPEPCGSDHLPLIIKFNAPDEPRARPKNRRPAATEDGHAGN